MTIAIAAGALAAAAAVVWLTPTGSPAVDAASAGGARSADPEATASARVPRPNEPAAPPGDPVAPHQPAAQAAPPAAPPLPPIDLHRQTLTEAREALRARERARAEAAGQLEAYQAREARRTAAEERGRQLRERHHAERSARLERVRERVARVAAGDHRVPSPDQGPAAGDTRDAHR